MFSKLRLVSKYQKLVASFGRKYGTNDGKHDIDNKVEVVDININAMMYDEYREAESNYKLTKEPILQSFDIDGLPIAPIDINPWIDEEELKEGTVLEDTIEKKEIISSVPEPPKDRSGVYRFKGIKIVLPKKLLSPATYRYRLDEDDLKHLADDMRICKFDK